ncbi:MAG: hypothetical protein S4CHLAM2_03650 [Chlamydiales bacterium]|nr:hypothetical protein [Chlamydiales bacterium]
MQTKLFVGTRLTPELKMQLGPALPSLTCIPYEGKEYLGRYLTSEHPTMEEVRTECEHFLLKLQERCPEFRVDNLPVVVFPQLFVG